MKLSEVPVAAAAVSALPAAPSTLAYSWYMQPTYTPAPLAGLI